MIFSFTELFNYFSGLLGMIIILIILARMKGRAEVKLGLVSTILVSSVIIILGALMYSGKAAGLPFLIRTDSPVHYLFGPACLLYTYSTFNPDFRFRWYHLLHLAPFFINIVEFTPFYLKSNAEKLAYYQGFLESGSVFMPLHFSLKTVSVLLYLLIQIYFFRKLKPKDKKERERKGYLLSWFRIFFTGQVVLGLGLILSWFEKFHSVTDPYFFAMMVLGIYLYAVTITLLLYPKILYGIDEKPKGSDKKYFRSKLSEEEKEYILDRLKTYLNGKQKPYLDPKITLHKISGELRITSNNLSQVINEKTGLNFNDYINSYRINESKNLLRSNDFKILTIDAIAKMSGFNSKSAFYSAFRKQTGLTPGEFLIRNNLSAKA
jgi:AraC-like DNA-binding protein